MEHVVAAGAPGTRGGDRRAAGQQVARGDLVALIEG